jgi:hypothetical protein
MSNLQGLSRAVQARLAAIHSQTATYRTSGTALAPPVDVARRVAALLERGTRVSRRSTLPGRS